MLLTDDQYPPGPELIEEGISEALQGRILAAPWSDTFRAALMRLAADPSTENEKAARAVRREVRMEDHVNPFADDDIDPDDYPWRDADDDTVASGAARGLPPAIAEAERRSLTYR